MSLKHKKIKDRVLGIYLYGSLDVIHVKEIEHELNTLIQNDETSDLIVNMKDVESISSTGLRLLLHTMETIKKRGKFFVLTDLSEEIKLIMKRVELTDLLLILDNEDEAMMFITGKN